MKKKVTLALCALLLMLPALASAEVVSMTELRQQVEEMGRWMQTYEAHKRKIEVDIPIDVPDVDVFPVVQVRGYYAAEQGCLTRDETGLNPVGKNGILDVYEEEGLMAYLGEKDLKGEITVADPDEDKSVILIADYHGPSHLRTHHVKYESETYYPYEVDAEKLYAEENPLSAASAKACLERVLKYFYPESENSVELRFLEVRSRGHKVKGLDDDKLGGYIEDYPMGTYALHFCQTIHGIPIYHDVGERLDTTGFDPEKIVDDAWQKAAPIMRISDNSFELMDTDSFELLVRWVKEVGIIEEDVPLAPLKSVISRIEDAIQKGYIRKVYALRLGYGCYVTDESPDVFSLYPTWICDCDYIENPKEEINPAAYSYGQNFHERYSFKTLVLNAQTCELDDIWLSKRAQIYCPTVITWEEAR